MDAWVPSDVRYGEFLEYCRRFGLTCLGDVKFVQAEAYSKYAETIGGEHLTTTKTLGFPIESEESGEIHCFVSADPEHAEEAFRYGWYPVVV